jgi:hypothetical protein
MQEKLHFSHFEGRVYGKMGEERKCKGTKKTSERMPGGGEEYCISQEELKFHDCGYTVATIQKRNRLGRFFWAKS